MYWTTLLLDKECSTWTMLDIHMIKFKIPKCTYNRIGSAREKLW